MAADRILVDRQKQGGALYIQMANTILQLQSLAAQLNGIVGHCNDGATYTLVETVLGLQAGNGANVATMIGNINNLFNTSTAVAGQTRIDQLNEIVGRVSGQ